MFRAAVVSRAIVAVAGLRPTTSLTPEADSTRSRTGRWHFALAAGLFFLVVLNRSSLGVAGRFAESRFGIGPGELSVFVMLQFGIYAALQVPAGALVDRFGPRRTLVTAGILTATAQLLFGVSRDYPAGVATRVVLGCGDALTFVSVLRVAANSVDRRRYPALVALTGLVGIAGNLAATLPLLVVLRTAGWELTFIGLAAATGTVAVTIHVVLREGVSAAPSLLRVGLARTAVRAWRQPETRLGFWLHFSCLTTAMTLLVLWGYPYLTRGAGMSEPAAGSVMFAGVLLSGAAMPVAGWWFSTRPDRRVSTAVAVAGGTAALWGFVLALGGTAPQALVAGVFIVSMVGVPASTACYAIVRDAVDGAVVSTATGVVNIGGYLATVLACLGVGLMLQLSGHQGPHDFRVALAAMVLVQVGGVIRIRVWSRRVGAHTRDRTSALSALPIDRDLPHIRPAVLRETHAAPPA